MHESLILTVIGDDRRGIVERISDDVLAAGANWEESWMARLSGKFAGILRVRVDAARAGDLTRRLTTLEAEGLKVIVERGQQDEAAASRTIGLELVGNDHPGIVRDISHALANHGVNIEELETEITSVPMSGEALFRARARLRIPPAMTPDELRAVLESLAGELMVDLSLDTDS